MIFMIQPWNYLLFYQNFTINKDFEFEFYFNSTIEKQKKKPFPNVEMLLKVGITRNLI